MLDRVVQGTQSRGSGLLADLVELFDRLAERQVRTAVEERDVAKRSGAVQALSYQPRKQINRRIELRPDPVGGKLVPAQATIDSVRDVVVLDQLA